MPLHGHCLETVAQVAAAAELVGGSVGGLVVVSEAVRRAGVGGLEPLSLPWPETA